MRRVAALVGQRIAAYGGGKAKTPHLNPSRGQGVGPWRSIWGADWQANTGVYTRSFGVQFPGAPYLSKIF